MSALHRIACLRDHRKATPNQKLAGDLAARHDQAGILWFAAKQWNQGIAVQAGRFRSLKTAWGAGGG